MPKIFVTGASGFIGGHLVKRLLKKGYQVKALTRDPNKKPALEKLGARVVVGNFDKAFLRKELKDCNFVYHLAATKETFLSEEEYFTSNILPTRNLLSAAQSQIKRFICISSAHVHGFPKELPISETSFYNPQTLYAKSKVAAEKEVLNFSSKLDYTIVRPVLVYGEGDKSQMIVKMAEQFKNPALFCVGSGRNRMHFIFIDDLIDGLLLMMKKEAKNQTFILAGEKPITISNLLGLIRRELELSKEIIYIPAFFVKPFTYLSKPISLITKKEPLVTKQRIDIISKDRFYSIRKAKELLGFKPKVNYKMGLRRTIDWYKRL